MAYHHAFPGRVATCVINEVKGVTRVVCDLTSKPPGTIECEQGARSLIEGPGL